MTHNSTVNKLIEMRLKTMSNALIQQEQDPKVQELSFEERLALLVDAEYVSRKGNRLKRLIKKADFDQPEAFVGDIDYHSGRKLNRSLIQKLSTCEFIVDHRNIFITGWIFRCGGAASPEQIEPPVRRALSQASGAS